LRLWLLLFCCLIRLSYQLFLIDLSCICTFTTIHLFNVHIASKKRCVSFMVSAIFWPGTRHQNQIFLIHAHDIWYILSTVRAFNACELFSLFFLSSTRQRFVIFTSNFTFSSFLVNFSTRSVASSCF